MELLAANHNEEPRGKPRGINPYLVKSFAASGGEFDPKRFKYGKGQILRPLG